MCTTLLFTSIRHNQISLEIHLNKDDKEIKTLLHLYNIIMRNNHMTF